MQGNFVRFTDSLNIEPLNIPDSVQDFYSKSENLRTTPLRVRIAATHAGKVTRNNGYYLPHRMRAGAHTFTAQYPKPIQVHHDSKRDPIGRVLAANYVDLTSVVRDSVRIKQFTDATQQTDNECYRLLDAFVLGKLSDSEALDFACKHFIDNVQVNTDPDYEGLGYIELIANITDPDAISKILDQRYLTGSTGAITDSAICSIPKCRQDWASDGKCEHQPGKVYDGAKCVLIAGNLSYDEYSFVNKPADRHSGIIEVNIGGIQDFVTVEHEDQTIQDHSRDHKNTNYCIYEIQMAPSRKKIDSAQEDNLMLFKDAFDRVSKHDFFQKLDQSINLVDAVKAVLDNKEIAAEEKKRELERIVADQLGCLEDFDKAHPKKVSDKSANELGTNAENVQDRSSDNSSVGKNHVREFFADKYDEIVGDDAWGVQYAEMLYSLLDGVEDEKERESITQQIHDAELSSEKRKSLPNSAFCGPERSFPVNDCAHYTAALRLIGRYKGPGDKDRIRACIERKGKRMGCNSESNEDSVQPSEYINPEYFDSYQDNEVLDMFTGLLKTIEDRGLDCGCADLATSKELEDSKQKIAELEQLLEDSKKQTSVSTDQVSEIEKLQQSLDAARKEVRYLHQDIENINAAIADNLSEIRQLHIQRLVDYKTISGEEVDIQALSDELKDKNTDDLRDMVKDLSGKVDTKKIADTLNSGLSNNPEGAVDDPTTMQDNTTDAQKPQLSGAQLNQLRLNHMYILKTQGETAARRYLDACKAEGLLIEDEAKQS